MTHTSSMHTPPEITAFEVMFSDLMTGEIDTAQEAVTRFCGLHGIPRDPQNPRTFQVKNVDTGHLESVEY